MADAPWRCSQCGTVNEPSANACRSCGRWPSLFDLEQGMLDVEEPEVEQAFERSAPAPEMYEPPVETPQPVEADYAEIPEEPSKQAEWRGPEDPLDRPTQGWPRLASWIVPIIFFVYVLISIFTNR